MYEKLIVHDNRQIGQQSLMEIHIARCSLPIQFRRRCRFIFLESYRVFCILESAVWTASFQWVQCFHKFLPTRFTDLLKKKHFIAQLVKSNVFFCYEGFFWTLEQCICVRYGKVIQCSQIRQGN